MNPSMRTLLSLAPVLILAAAGCSASLVEAHGKVVRNGKPIALSKTGTIDVIFIPVVEAGKPFTTYPAVVETDGSFKVRQLPRGKYRIAVFVRDPNPQVDKLKSKFSNDKTKIEREVNGKDAIDVDLDKAEG
jgi:hypothetical protein